MTQQIKEQQPSLKGIRGHQLMPILLSHGWINLEPALMIDDGFKYSFLLTPKIPITVTVRSQRGKVVLDADRKLTEKQNSLLETTLRRMLSLDFPMKSFRNLCRTNKAQRLLQLSQQGWGRMFRSPTAWEDAVKTLFTTNASWGYTRKMCSRLCHQFGAKTNSGLQPFPSASSILTAKKSSLRNVGIGYRHHSLLKLAERFESGQMIRLDGSDGEATEEAVRSEIVSWHGFGKYATDHMMVLLGYYSAVPIDREVAKYLENHMHDYARRLEHWGRFQFIAYKLMRVSKRRSWIGD